MTVKESVLADEVFAPRFTLAPGVTFTRNRETGAALIYTADDRILHLGAGIGRLCELVAGRVAGTRESDLVAALAGEGWSAPAVGTGLRALVDSGVARPLDSITARRALHRSPRVQLRRAPFSVRLTVANPEALCRRLAPLAVLLRGRTALALAVLGVLIQIGEWLGAPASLPASTNLHAVPAILVALLATCVLHELAHGIVLTRAGGRPRRMGFMLLYLVMPAFFCDVSDSFRLRRRDQVDVALAGVVLQAQLGALTTPLMLARSTVAAMTRGYVQMNLLLMAANLLPFVALDGYFALRAAVGAPNLRSMAIAAWRRTASRWLHGQWRREAGAPPRWLVAFGCGAAVMPVVVTAVSLRSLAALLGAAPALQHLVVLLAPCAWFAAVGIRRLTRSLRRLPMPARAALAC